MIRVGLTGGIASGKTTVCNLLQEKGCTILDADVVAHHLLLRGQRGYEPVVSAFGPGILGAEGQIDRRKLGALVFENPILLERLNKLVHPDVIREIRAKLEAFERLARMRVVVDASLMIESGLHHDFQRLILVTCTLEQQLERLINRNGVSLEQAQQRIALQMPLEDKRVFATDIIDNSGTTENTRRQVDILFEDLERTAWTTRH